MLESVQKLKSLERFSYAKNSCTVEFGKQLAHTVRQFRNLTCLNLAHCDMGDKVFSEFCQTLKSSSLQELNLSWNRLTNESCHQMRILLEDNESLQTLLIQHNDLGGKSFHVLASRIEKMPNLAYLDISFNNLENSGF